MTEIIQWRFNNWHFIWVLIPLILIWAGKIYHYKKYLYWKKNAGPAAHLFPSIKISLLTIKMGLLLASYILLTAALLRPQILHREYPSHYKGRDIIFLLDVSKSMLAEDVPPNRLEKAKFIVKDILTPVHSDRASLAIFGGSTAILTPLTYDYHHIEYLLEEVSPEHISRGGTQIGDALRFINENLIQKNNHLFTDIILLSDGEDHGSFPGQSARIIGQKGIRIITIGIGTPEGAMIPDPNTSKVLYHEGKPVVTKLDENLLREIASVANGIYLPWHFGVTNFRNVYTELRQNVPVRKKEFMMQQVWKDLFYPFLLGGCIFLIVSFMIRPFSETGTEK